MHARLFELSIAKGIKKMSDHAEISCPYCGEKILLDVKMLLRGGRFSCCNPICETTISLSSSSYNVTQNALDKFESIKKNKLLEGASSNKV